MFTSPGFSEDLKIVHSDNCIKCQICMTYKPERGMHCNVCNKCVLRMENHCIWVNNCIGYYNYKACILMCFYLTLCGLYHVFIEFYIIFFCKGIRKIFHPIIFGLYLFTGILYFLLTLALLTFDLQYVLQLIYGITMIERFRYGAITHSPVSCDWTEKIREFPYNVGWIANFERMFSKGGWYSLLPFTDYKDYGFDFEEIPQYLQDDNKKKKDKKLNDNDYLSNVTKKYENVTLVYGNLLEINGIK